LLIDLDEEEVFISDSSEDETEQDPTANNVLD
jgi:hypothetical protein